MDSPVPNQWCRRKHQHQIDTLLNNLILMTPQHREQSEMNKPHQTVGICGWLFGLLIAPKTLLFTTDITIQTEMCPLERNISPYLKPMLIISHMMLANCSLFSITSEPRGSFKTLFYQTGLIFLPFRVILWKFCRFVF